MDYKIRPISVGEVGLLQNFLKGHGDDFAIMWDISLSLLLARTMTVALLAYEKGKTAGITQTFAPHVGELKAACRS